VKRLVNPILSVSCELLCILRDSVHWMEWAIVLVDFERAIVLVDFEQGLSMSWWMQTESAQVSTNQSRTCSPIWEASSIEFSLVSFMVGLVGEKGDGRWPFNHIHPKSTLWVWWHLFLDHPPHALWMSWREWNWILERGSRWNGQEIIMYNRQMGIDKMTHMYATKSS